MHITLSVVSQALLHPALIHAPGDRTRGRSGGRSGAAYRPNKSKPCGRARAAATTRAWREALIGAGIDNFPWHDRRHTWARWQPPSGTPLAVWQDLGGWSSDERLRAYAYCCATNVAASARTCKSPRRKIRDRPAANRAHRARAELLLEIGTSRAQLDAFLTSLTDMIEPVQLDFLRRPQLRDAADEMVEETAANASADVLVSHNISDFRAIVGRFIFEVVTPGDFLRRYQS